MKLIEILRLSGPLTDANFWHFNWLGILLLTDLVSRNVVHLRLFDAFKVIALYHLVVRFLFQQTLLKAPLERQLRFYSTTVLAFIMIQFLLLRTIWISALGLVVVRGWARLERLPANRVLAVAKSVLDAHLKRT